MSDEHKHEEEHEHVELTGAPRPRSDELDAAGKSLSDALRISFVILKIIMIVLVVAFLASGFRTVESDEKGIVLRFGQIQRIVDPGPLWILPYPIDELIKIPVQRKVNLAITAYWYKETREDILPGLKSRGLLTDKLNPLQEGYCLTRSQRAPSRAIAAVLRYEEGLPLAAPTEPNAAAAQLQNAVPGLPNATQDADASDYNIVHTRWQIIYHIESVGQFFRNVYVRDVQPGQVYFDIMNESISPLLRSIVGDAIVDTMVQYTIDEALQSIDTIPGRVRQLAQQKLDALESGIRVNPVQLVDVTWPKQVDSAFQDFFTASQKSQEAINEARTYAGNTLNEVAGRVARPLYGALLDENVSDEQREQLWAQVAGEAQNRIAQAKAYRTKVVETTKANADYLLSLLPEYRKRPELVAQRIYLDAIEEVFANAEEKFIVQRSAAAKDHQTRILLNRNPTPRAPKRQE